MSAIVQHFIDFRSAILSMHRTAKAVHPVWWLREREREEGGIFIRQQPEKLVLMYLVSIECSMGNYQVLKLSLVALFARTIFGN